MFSISPGGSSPQAAARWARQNFCGVPLGDMRRNRRLLTLAEAMVSRPGASIPAMMNSAYDIKAAYTLFDRPEATPDTLQAAHRRRTFAGATAYPGAVLLIEDTTTMSWSGNEPVTGLGPVGSFAEGLQGFLLHSVLAAAWPVEAMAHQDGRRPSVGIFGLLDQQYVLREQRPGQRDKGSARRRTSRALESHLWDRSVERIGLAPSGTRWVRIADRGADIYEYMQQTLEARMGFVVRAAQDRALVDERGNKVEGKLFQVARAGTDRGGFDLELRARPGQKARTARMRVCSAKVRIRAPQRPGHDAGTRPPLACTVLRIFEPEVPEEVRPLEWIVLTDAEIDSGRAALEVAAQYASRWIIEEFHKALKTGMGAERLQLKTADRLFAAISVLSVAALELIDLRERIRQCPDEPAEQAGLEPTELEVLQAIHKKPIRTVRDVALAIGRLGGHMNRRGDGLPGWKTLWIGRGKLRDMTDGYRLARARLDSG